MPPIALDWQETQGPNLARFTRSISEVARPQLPRKAARTAVALLEWPLFISGS
jgi:hypothetical protein